VRVVTASYDHTAQVWDAKTGKPVTVPLEHQEAVTAAAFSPDGTRVVTASCDKRRGCGTQRQESR
jgi:WD40 repeat protein